MFAAKRFHSAGRAEGRQLDHIFYDGFKELGVSVHLFAFLGNLILFTKVNAVTRCHENEYLTRT